MPHAKVGSNKEREAGDFTKLPPRYPAVKNKEIEQFGVGFDRQDRVLLTHSNGRRGRGRGSRGGSRGSGSRSRGGKVPIGIGSSSRIQFRDDNDVSYEKVPQKKARRGRGRGRGRGLRTVRPRQPSELISRSIRKANLLGSFSMLSKANHTSTAHSPESSGAEEWALERRDYVKDDENNSVSQSDESEENEENGEPMSEEYDEQLPNYSRDNSGSSPLQTIDDGSEDDDEDAEGDEGEDGDDYEAEHPIGDEDDDVEMGEDDEIHDDDDEGGGAENADEDEGGTSSYSSEYSD